MSLLNVKINRYSNMTLLHVVGFKNIFLYKTFDIASAFFHTFGASRPSFKHADANIYILIESSFTPQKTSSLAPRFMESRLRKLNFQPNHWILSYQNGHCCNSFEFGSLNLRLSLINTYCNFCYNMNVMAFTSNMKCWFISSNCFR